MREAVDRGVLNLTSAFGVTTDMAGLAAGSPL
jgi:hypothetical protein